MTYKCPLRPIIRDTRKTITNPPNIPKHAIRTSISFFMHSFELQHSPQRIQFQY
jgi:hypothetical protein